MSVAGFVPALFSRYGVTQRGLPGVPAGVAPAGLGSGERGSTAPRSPSGGVPTAGSLGQLRSCQHPRMRL